MSFFFLPKLASSQNPYITGPDSICYNTEYTLTVLEAEDNAIYQWSYVIQTLPPAGIIFDNIGQTDTSFTFTISSVGFTNTGIIKLFFYAVDWNTNANELEKCVHLLPTVEDMMVFPGEVCYDSGDFQFMTPYQQRYLNRNVCLGDTTSIDVRWYTYNNGNIPIPPFQKFTPDRLDIRNGYLINYDDLGFTAVWDQLGKKEIKLITENEIGCQDTLVASVTVMPITSFPILSDQGINTLVEVCKYENVHLEVNLTTGGAAKWISNDGRVFYGNAIDVSFDTPGTYEIEVIDDTVCSCVEPSIQTIVVKDGPTPQIECTGTVCEGEEVSYFSATSCNSYLWTVSAEGTITEGGGVNDNYITVQWLTAPGGNVMLETPGCFTAACSEMISVDIPIVGTNATITGPDEVCFNEIATYFAPAYDGTDYQWSVSQQGTILSGNGTNSIVVEWESALHQISIATIDLYYNNCYINCDGNASFILKILPPVTVDYSDQSLCRNAILSCQTQYGVDVTWEVTDPTGITTNYPLATDLNVALGIVGSYMIEAIAPPGTTCNDRLQFSVEVLADPAPPTGIIESVPVCQGLGATYSVSNLGAFDIVHWTVYDGSTSTPTTSTTTKNLNYTWTTSGPYIVEAAIENTLTGCIGAAASFTLSNDVFLEGMDLLCQGDLGMYYLDTDIDQNINWSIIPASAGDNVSSINDTLEVIWKSAGTFIVEARLCNRVLQVNVTVAPAINLTLLYPTTCPADQGQITGIVPGGVTLEVINETGGLIATSLPANVNAGDYLVQATNSAGCEYFENVTIEKFALPEVRVSSPQGNVFCVITSPVTLVADSDGTYTIEWYRNGMSLGLFGPTITTMDFGTYYVVITDSNGCMAQSVNTHTIIEFCPGGGGGTPSTPLDLTTLNGDCNNLTFTIDPPYNSTVFNWNFDDPESGNNNFATGFSVMHEFTHAGYYYVVAIGNMNEDAVKIVEIGVVADFEVEDGCAGQGIQFKNKTSYINGFDINDYLWDFGDSATSTLKDPTHTYAFPGVYAVTLTSTDINGCISTETKSVEVFDVPFVIVNYDPEICINKTALFTVSPDEVGSSYEWDFGDPTSTQNTSSQENPSHTFLTAGVHTVSLIVTNADGCSSSQMVMIDVVGNNMSGDITSDIPMPKCPQNSVTLSAPLGADNYIWSTGATTQSINVVDDGLYGVTLTNSAQCVYVPSAFQVNSVSFYNASIIGLKSNVSFGENRIHYDSIEVCLGEHFDLIINEIPNTTVLWSNGATDILLKYSDHFANLAPGRYQYSVVITDVPTNCSKDIGPFYVIINDLPPPPIIIDDQTSPCEGDMHQLSISNYDPNLTYRWQDDKRGPTYETQQAGEYYVRAYDQNGCSSRSNSIYIQPLPSVLGWMTGCREVCFPEEICLTLNPSNINELLLNGMVIESISPFASTLNISSPGDYAVQITNFSGCTIVTDVLSLTAITDQQTLTGIVYYDENQNGVFDGMDLLLEDVIVNLMSGNTIVSSFITDATGAYDFSSFPGVNHHIELDVSMTNYIFSGVMDSIVTFQNCLEDQIIDFPLINECFLTTTRIDTFICPGTSIFIEGMEYFANDTDTLSFSLSANCDSIVTIQVLEFVEPLIDLVVTASCANGNDGNLEIVNNSGEPIQYSIDNGPLTMDTNITGLSPGQHTLYIHDLNDCAYPVVFDIEELIEPLVDIVTFATCKNISDGSISIDILQGSDLQFSIDGITPFSMQIDYFDLNEGNFMLSTMDTLGCVFQTPFSISAFDEPDFTTLVSSSCEGENTGSLEIDITSGNVQFAVNDPNNFSSTIIYDLLPVGQHTLYSMSDDGCLDSLVFEINMVSEPMVGITTFPACEDNNPGDIYISTTDPTLTYSMDGINFHDINGLNQLSSGMYVLYYMTTGGCVFEQPFEIEEIAAPIIERATTPTCEGQSNGTFEILAVIGDYAMFSIDGINYQSGYNFDFLPAGMYTLYVINEEDCIYEFPFTIIESPGPGVDVLVDHSCANVASGVVSVYLDDANDLISFNGGPSTGQSTYTDLAPGTYTISVMDELQCEFNTVVEILELPELDAEVVEFLNDCNDKPITITPVINSSAGVVNFEWSDGSSDPTFSTFVDGNYAVTISDDCQEELFEWDLTFNFTDEEQKVYIPNIFSANEDNLNDCFLVNFDPQLEVLSYSIIIFDRWGNRMYVSEDRTDCWDGYFKGIPVVPGVYVYIIRATVNACEGPIRMRRVGDVTVIQ